MDQSQLTLVYKFLILTELSKQLNLLRWNKLNLLIQRRISWITLLLEVIGPGHLSKLFFHENLLILRPKLMQVGAYGSKSKRTVEKKQTWSRSASVYFSTIIKLIQISFCLNKIKTMV